MILPIATVPCDGSEVVKIPGSLDLPGAGGGQPWRYRIGPSASHPGEGGSEIEPRDVLLDRFAIQVEAVSNASYRAFVESREFRDREFWNMLASPGETLPWDGEGEPPLPRLWQRADFDIRASADHPVVALSWFEASGYARWCGGRLPSETQWEVAASYHFEDPPRKHRYPWGGGEDGRTFQDLFGRVPCGELWDHAALIEASRNPTNRCQMMIGFHWEWCRERFDGAGGALTALSSSGGRTLRGVRGGCTLGFAGALEATSRFAFDPTIALERLGFRCVFDGDFDEGDR